MKEKDDGPVIEDVLGQHRKAKIRRLATVNSKRKGGNFQTEVGNMLGSTYQEVFSSTPGSGGIATARKLDDGAAEVLSGDLMNSRYMFTIEAKKGYDNIKLVDLFADDNKSGSKTSQDQVLEFIKQAEEESKKSGKAPLVIWSQTRKPAICIMHHAAYEYIMVYLGQHTVMHWRGYVIFAFSVLLRVPKEIVFVGV